MAKHDRAACEKRARNAAYADQYPRRNRKARKDARAAKVAERDRGWCLAHGVDPTPPKALRDVIGSKRQRRRNRPSVAADHAAVSVKKPATATSQPNQTPAQTSTPTSEQASVSVNTSSRSTRALPSSRTVSVSKTVTATG